MKYNSNTINKIKSIEDNISFDGVLNLALLVFDIKQISRLENVDDINALELFLNEIELFSKKKDEETLYVSKTKKCLDIWFYYDSKDNNDIYFWKLLWFPDCCIKKFTSIWWIDKDNMFSFLKDNVENKLESSNYLNFFENKLIYHIPCSMTCKKSVSIWEKAMKLFLLLNNDKRIEDVLSNKTYILFENFQWLRIEDNKYGFWSIFGYDGDENIKRIKDWYKIDIIWENKITLFKDSLNNVEVDNVIVFNFI